MRLTLKGEASPPDTPLFTLETSPAHKCGVGIGKMKEAASLRVGTAASGLEVPPGGVAYQGPHGDSRYGEHLSLFTVHARAWQC